MVRGKIIIDGFACQTIGIYCIIMNMKRILPFLLCILLLLVFSTCKNKKEAEKNIPKTSENKVINDEQQQSVSSFNREFLNYNFYTLNLYNEVNYNINKWRLTFLSDNRYEFRPLVEDNFYKIEGSYQIIDNKVLLKYIGMPYGEYDKYKFDSILKENWELKYTTISNSLYFSEGLIGKGIIFAREKYRENPIETRTVNGHDLIMVQGNEEGYILTSNVVVRMGPGINFQHCIFEWINNYESDHASTSTTDYLEEGKRIYIIGHSKNTDTINGVTGYWYYCHINIYFDSGGKIIEPKTVKNNNCWIFEASKYSEKFP